MIFPPPVVWPSITERTIAGVPKEEGWSLSFRRLSGKGLLCGDRQPRQASVQNCQCLIQILDDILHGLDTYRQTYEPIADADTAPFFRT